MRRVLIALALLFLPLAPAGAGDHAYCHQASGAEAAGNYDLAIDYYTRCLKSVDLSIGNQAIFYNNRGEVYYRKGEYDRAIADYDQALRLDPDYASNNRGRAHFYRGRFAQAVPDLRRAVAADPENAFRVLWLYLAQARAGQGGRTELGDNARHGNSLGLFAAREPTPRPMPRQRRRDRWLLDSNLYMACIDNVFDSTENSAPSPRQNGV